MWKREKSIHFSPKVVKHMGKWSLATARLKSNSAGTHTFCRKSVLPSLWKECVRVYLPSFNPFYWGKYFNRWKMYILLERASVILCIRQIYSTGLEKWYSKRRQILTCMKINMVSTKYLSTLLLNLFLKIFQVNFVPYFVNRKVLDLYYALYTDSPLKLGINMYIYVH